MVNALFCLANLSLECDANRVHVLQSGITQRTMLVAGKGAVEGGAKRPSEAACLLLQSLSLNPRCRLRLVERDCVRLMFDVMSSPGAAPGQVAGTAGTVLHLSRTAGQTQKYVALGGLVLTAKMLYESSHPAALKTLLELVMALAADDEHRRALMQEGAVRATLNLLDQQRRSPVPICELACECLALFAADPGAKLHMQKIGVEKVLSEFGDAKQNRFKSERVSHASRLALSLLSRLPPPQQA